MSDTLIDPTRPPHALIETRDDGSALRNDGVALKPANANPWYVLATVHGEQDGKRIDWDLHAQNRRIWNGWACGGLDDAARQALAEELDLPVEDLAALSSAELDLAKAALGKRLPAGARDGIALGADGLPDPGGEIRLGETHFSNTIVLEKCVFSGDAMFRSARFSGDALFGSARFSGDANFRSARFSGFAYFRSARFSGDAWFRSARFSGDANFRSVRFNGFAVFEPARFNGSAYFRSARFSGTAWFRSARFNGSAWFLSARFSGPADFVSARFSGPADFRNEAFAGVTSFEHARFETSVPKFYERKLHQDAVFTTQADNWPDITADNAAEGKRAYTRLRQLMNEVQKPDDEHFFFRQEMRCKAHLETGLDRWANRIFGLVSDYGHSIARPLCWLFCVWLAAALVYGGSFYVACNVWGSQCHTVATPFGLSFSSLFSFLGLSRLFFADVMAGLPGALKALAGAQTVAGVILMFFLGLGLRNHFRLK